MCHLYIISCKSTLKVYVYEVWQKSNETSWFVFFKEWELSTQDLFLQEKLATKFFFYKDVLERPENRHCWQMDAPSTQFPMSHCPLRLRFWALKHSCGSSAPYSPDVCSCESFFFLNLKISSKDVISGLQKTTKRV
jgi:hypothetical protein